MGLQRHHPSSQPSYRVQDLLVLLLRQTQSCHGYRHNKSDGHTWQTVLVSGGSQNSVTEDGRPTMSVRRSGNEDLLSILMCVKMRIETAMQEKS